MSLTKTRSISAKFETQKLQFPIPCCVNKKWHGFCGVFGVKLIPACGISKPKTRFASGFTWPGMF